jgi:hypothetical protein
VKLSEFCLDDLIKEENKAPDRLNLFSSFDQNDSKFLISNSFVHSENETIKASTKMLFAKDFGFSF